MMWLLFAFLSALFAGLTAILAKNIGITLIDLYHHESEIPGLYELSNILSELNIKLEVIDKKPITILR